MGYCHINTWSRPSRCYTAGGVLKNLSHGTTTRTAGAGANGDRIQIFMVARGNETTLNLGTHGLTISGIFDVYINGVLDSAGYDDYLAVPAEIHRIIALTQPIRKGYNVIELRLNGKNALSTGWYVYVYGASLQ